MKGLKKILVNPNISIKQALRQMDKASKKALFIIDRQNTILGLVTDGDIRRWILKGKSLNRPVGEAMNKRPILLEEGHTKQEAKEVMLSHGIDCLPIVDKNKKVISIIRWFDLFGGEFKKPKARMDLPIVIMAGGEGKRLSPFTNVLPKPLVPIGEKPILELIMEKFAEYGCKDFYLSLNYKSNIIKAYLSESRHSYNVSYIQEERPLGTAGSLRLLMSKIKNTFITTNCDTLIEADYFDILEFHRRQKNKLTLVGSMKHYGIPYGVCDIDNGGSLKKIREKPEYDFLVITGFYILEPDILKNIPENKFYHMTDLINDYIKRDEKIGVYPVSEKSWLDLGQWEELQELLKKFRVE